MSCLTYFCLFIRLSWWKMALIHMIITPILLFSRVMAFCVCQNVFGFVLHNLEYFLAVFKLSIAESCTFTLFKQSEFVDLMVSLISMGVKMYFSASLNSCQYSLMFSRILLLQQFFGILNVTNHGLAHLHLLNIFVLLLLQFLCFQGIVIPDNMSGNGNPTILKYSYFAFFIVFGFLSVLKGVCEQV